MSNDNKPKDVEEEMKDRAWETVQKTAFTYWVNSYLDRRGKKINSPNDLEEDFSDGVTVIDFIELLLDSRIKTKYSKQPKNKINKIENCSIALNFLKDNGVQQKMLTISPEDFVDKNLKFILGFLWMLFRKFRINKNIAGAEDRSTEENLLKWVREITQGYPGVKITDFGHSFNDGLAFLAMVNKFDPKLFNYNEYMEENSSVENIEAAFELAEKSLGVPKLLDVNELANGTIDERSIVLYVSLFFHAFVSQEEKRRLENAQRETKDKLTGLEDNLAKTLEEKEILEKKYKNLTTDHDALKAKYEESEARNAKLQNEKEALENEVAELRAKYNKLKEKVDERSALELKALDLLRKNLIEHLNDMNRWKDYLEQDREYESEKIQERTEKEIIDRNFEDQLEYLADALGSENRKLQVLLKQREIEEQQTASAKNEKEDS
jgi:cortexillin 1/2